MRFTALRLSALLGAVLLLTAGAPPAAAQTPPPPVCGDCNGDGDVNILDAQVVATFGAPLATCDTNLNGAANSADAVGIAQWSAAITSVLFCPSASPTGAVPSISAVTPYNGATGNCINGVAWGRPFRFRLISSAGGGATSAVVGSAAVGRGSSGVTLAQTLLGLVNNNTNYLATSTPSSPHCLIFQDPGFNQAHIEFFPIGGGSCVPDFGTSCFGTF